MTNALATARPCSGPAAYSPTSRPVYAGGAAAADDAGSLLTGLLAGWKLDEESGKRADVLGNYDLTLADAAIGSDTGINGNAADFDGTGEQALENSDSAFNFAGGAAAISCWAYPNAAGNLTLFSKYGAAAAERSYSVTLVTAVTLVSCNFQVDESTIVSPTTGIGAFTMNAWNHVVMNWTGAAVQLWVNGAMKDSDPAAALNASSTPFNVGAFNGDGNNFRGLVDDCYAWSRALTEAEITALYNAGSGLAHPFS